MNNIIYNIVDTKKGPHIEVIADQDKYKNIFKKNFSPIKRIYTKKNHWRVNIEYKDKWISFYDTILSTKEQDSERDKGNHKNLLSENIDKDESKEDEVLSEENKEDDSKEDEALSEENKEDESKEDEALSEENKEDDYKEDEVLSDENREDEVLIDENKDDDSKEDEVLSDENREDESKEDEVLSEEDSSNSEEGDEYVKYPYCINKKKINFYRELGKRYVEEWDDSIVEDSEDESEEDESFHKRYTSSDEIRMLKKKIKDIENNKRKFNQKNKI